METMTAERALKCVKSGAAILDEKEPGWRALITKRLDASEPQFCPVGQIALSKDLSFSEMAARLGVFQNLAKYGFGIKEPDNETDESAGIAFALLTGCWNVIIGRE